MKMLTYLLPLLCLALLPVRGDGANWVQNGDFADGATHWRGNGRTSEDFSRDNPLDKPDPFLSKGLIIPLRHRDWDKVAQDFKGKSANGILKITYMVAPDLVFSTKAEDYVNMPWQLHYDGWGSVDTPAGAWVVFLVDQGTTHGTYWTVTPKLGSGDVQTFASRVTVTPYSDKTITLGFPPGTGNLVILSVSIVDQ